MAKQTILKRLLKGLKTRFMGLLLPVLALFSILLFSLPSGAFAGTVIQSDDTNASLGRDFSQTFTGISGDLTSIQLRLHTENPSYSFENMTISFSGDGYSCGFGYEYVPGSGSAYSYMLLTPSGCTGIMSATSTYTLHINSSDESRIWTQYGSTASTYAGGSASESCWEYGIGTFDCTELADLSFWLLYDENPGLYIISPTEYATTTTNGLSLGWIIQNDIASSTNTGIVIWPTLQPTQKQSAEIAEAGGVIYLPDTFTYTPNYYQGYAYAKNGSTILATSTIRNFVVEVPPDITTSTAYSACDTEDSSWFGRAFCRSMVFLFAPHKPVLENFTRLSTRADKVMPFSIFADIRDAMTISATSTDQLISSSTLSAFSIFATFKTGLGVILWLIFAFWAIRALRHIQH